MSIFDPTFHSKKQGKIKKPLTRIPAKAAVKKEGGVERSNDEIQQTIARMKQMHNELNNQIDKIFQLSGRDPSEVNDYFSNPSNFPSKVWSGLQQRRESLEETLSGLSPKDYKERKATKQAVKLAKDRKSKTLGARKNWLSMR
ncbi:MAG: hypothetical protein ACSNEK_03725 [Parachlamydiaceae bacterium]